MADLEDGEILDSESEDIVDESSGVTAGAVSMTNVKVEDEMTVDQVKDASSFNSSIGHHNIEMKKEPGQLSLHHSKVKEEPTDICFKDTGVKAEPSVFSFAKKETNVFSFHESNLFNVRDNAVQFSTRRSPQKPHQNRDRSDIKYNDDGSSASSDEDTDLWKCKKARYFSSSKDKTTEIKVEITSPPRNGQISSGNSNPTKSNVRKINNIWGSVLAEQDVSDIFSSVGVEKNPDVEDSDRNVEKYDYTKAYDDKDRPFLTEVKPECHDPFNKVVNVDITDLEKDIVRNVNPSLKRKRGSVKDRIMDLSEWKYDENKSREHFGVTFEDSDAKIVNAIAIQLDEPKIDLLAKVVEVLGSKKALETAYLTEDVEDAGGMMTFDGCRRRTPGGVYIQLLKKDKEVSKNQYKEIFGEEERQYKKACRMEQKRRRQEQRRLYSSLPQSRYAHNSKNRWNEVERMDDGSSVRKHHKKKKKKRREKHDSEMKDDNDKSSEGESENDIDYDTGEVKENKGDNSPGLEEIENFDEEIEDIVIG